MLKRPLTKQNFRPYLFIFVHDENRPCSVTARFLSEQENVRARVTPKLCSPRNTEVVIIQSYLASYSFKTDPSYPKPFAGQNQNPT